MSSNNDSATQVPVAELHDEGNSSPNNNNSNVTEAVNTSGVSGASDSAQTYFIGNLPRESTEVDVLNYFASYGPVERFKLCYSSDGRTRGFGWLTFARPVHDLVQRGPYRMGGRELTVEPSHARIYNRSGVSVSSLAGRRHVSSGGGGGASGPGVVGSRRHMSNEHALMSGAVGATVLYGGVGDSEHARRARRHGRGHRRNRSPSSRSSSSSSYTSSSTSSASSRASSRSSTSHKRNSGGRRKTKHARHKDAPPLQPMPSPATAVVPPPPAAATTSSTTAASSAAAPPHPFAPPSASPSDVFVCLPMALCPPQFLCDPRVFAARLDRTRVGALTICGSVMQSPFTPHEQQQQQQQQQPSSTMAPSVARHEQTAAMAANYHHVHGLATPDHIATLPQHPSSANMTLPSPPPPPSSSSSSALRHGMSASHGAPFASYASLQSYGVMQPPLSSSLSSSSSSVPQSSTLSQQQQQQKQRPAMPH